MIYVMSGGSNEVLSAIIVSYPSGSVCTASNGQKTITAPDTSGSVIFNVETGTWTISCTDGVNSKSKSVTIISDSEIHEVILRFNLVLFDAGSYSSETGGWSKSGSTLSINATTNSMDGATDTVYAKNRIDVTGFTTLCFQISSTTKTRSGYRLVGLSDATSGSGFIVYKDVTTTGTVSVDISNITTPYYVRMALEATPPENGVVATTSIAASKIWLE